MAAIYSAVLGAAEYCYQHDTFRSVSLSARLVPDNSAYLTRLAAWDSAKRLELLKRAVHVNPFDDAAWIRLGLDEELQRHNLPEAEQDLLQAVWHDRMFLPRWTLTNFYFRHGEKEKFLHWAKESLEITPYRADPIFANMWLYDPDAKQLSQYIPDRPGILAQYVIFLTASRQFDALPPVISRLVKAGSENPEGWGLDDIVGPTEDRLLYSGYGALAEQIWNTLVDGRWLPFNPVGPTHPLTNGDFQVPFWGHGFDWQSPSANGLSVMQEAEASDVRFTLDGNEDDHATLIQQWVPLSPGRRYRLQWVATSDNFRQPSGLAWDLQSGPVQLVSGDVLPDKEKPNWVFIAPAGASTAHLSLQYHRPIGEVRADGTLILKAVRLSAE